MRSLSLMSLVGMLVVSSATFADDKPLTRAELDKRAARVAYDTIDQGALLFNNGRQEACYHLYEGSLLALKAVLDHRPDLVKTIADQVAAAKSKAALGDKAFALREALDEVLKLGLPPKSDVPAKTALWDRLGGQKAVEAVVHDFVAVAAKDPKVNFFRDGKFKVDAAGVEKLEKSVVELVSAVTGGPLKYTGKDMKAAHAGMKITEEEFDALAGHFVATLKKFKVPQKETDELVKIVVGTKKDIVEVKK